MQLKKTKILRLVALCLCLLLFFAGCKGKKEEIAPEQTTQSAEGTSQSNSQKIILPYFLKDGFNPFYAVSNENRALSSLFAEPLYRVKSDYTAEPILALDSEMHDHVLLVTLQTKEFSNGKNLTPKDVVYSFEKAKASAWYGARLSKISRAKATRNSVEFYFNEPDILAQNLLTFPIVEAGTADSAEQIPIGTGVYILKSGGEVLKNEKNAMARTAQPVALEGAKNVSYLKNALEIGNISFMFSDFQKGYYERVVAKNTFVTLNNLVFLGMNHQKMPLNSAALRTAIYYAIDKVGVASSAFQGCAEAVAFPLHPNSAESLAVKNPTMQADTKKAQEILNKIGYNRLDKDGYLSNGSQNLTMTILVNDDNPFRVAAAEFISNALKELGFAVSLERVPYEIYRQRLSAGDYFLYVGEVKLPEDLDLSAFFVPGGAASGYMDLSLPVASMATKWHHGDENAQAFAETFLDDMPFVPLCYRAGMAAYEKELSPDFSMASYAIPSNFGAWKLSS